MYRCFTWDRGLKRFFPDSIVTGRNIDIPQYTRLYSPCRGALLNIEDLGKSCASKPPVVSSCEKERQLKPGT